MLYFRKIEKLKKRCIKQMLVAIFRIIYGSVLTISGIVIGKHIVVTGLCNAMRGIGSIAGLFGFIYQPYKKTQGK